jgi:AAA domain
MNEAPQIHRAEVYRPGAERTAPPVAPLDQLPNGYAGRGERSGPAATFKLVDWNDVKFDPNEEWLVEDVLPMRGFGLIYGKPRSFKSFTALDLALHVVLGAPWAGKRVERGNVVYIAAEGAAGMRKRIVAYQMKHKVLPGAFALIEEAPNLGADQGDLPALIAAVESARIKSTFLVIDTASKSIGAAEENSAGMAAFVLNAGKLAQHFDCLVLGVHHVGLGDDAQKRPRGWSGLGGALDVQILCERPGDEKRTALHVQKLKDGEDGVCFEARLSRVVIGIDKNGKEASTLIVDDVAEAEAAASVSRSGTVPPSRRLLSEIIAQAIDESGETFRPFPDGPLVQGVYDEHVRDRYYAAVAEKADPSDDPNTVAERQRKAFNRAVKAEIDAKRLMAKGDKGRRLLWLP